MVRKKSAVPHNVVYEWGLVSGVQIGVHGVEHAVIDYPVPTTRIVEVAMPDIAYRVGTLNGLGYRDRNAFGVEVSDEDDTGEERKFAKHLDQLQREI
jgi:hypothetical protein